MTRAEARRPTRRAVLGGAAAATAGLVLAPSADARTISTGGITLRDGHGLTVLRAERWAWERRLVYVRLGTREVTGWGGGGPGVNVLLPSSYDANPRRRYPVVHLFHGGGQDADFRQWHAMENLSGGGSMVLDETASTEAIFVMPDISKGGWGLDARHEWPWWRRHWETFHLDQLVPWVDATFRTISDARARAVVGYSMGGFAALHHMAKRPELFAAVSCYSGPSALDHHSLQTYMYVSPVVDQLNPGALLGRPVRWDTSMVPVEELKWLPPLASGGDPAVYASENPRAHLESFRGKRVALISGDDTEDGNEGPVIQDQPQLAAMLRAKGIPVTQYHVVGNHLDAVRRAFPQDIPRVVAHLTPAG